MFSYEDRKRAVELYIQYNLSAAAVIRELGYPNRHSLAKWYKEYINNGRLKKQRKRSSKYSTEQRKVAVEYYLSHGKNMNQTIQALGYFKIVFLFEVINLLRQSSDKVVAYDYL